MKKIIFLIILCSITKSEIYELSIQPNNSSEYHYADFKIWFDGSIDTLEGVYLYIHGHNGDSRGIVNSYDLQSITLSQKFALLGCRLSHVDMSSGIGDAVLSFMDSLSLLSNRQEFLNIPFFINGYSWGGQFGYHFTKWLPQKVLGLISQKGGYHDTTFAEQAIEVPMLFFIGENDLQYRIDNLTGIFFHHRPYGAKWILSIDKNSGHSQIIDDHLLNEYFYSIVEYRLNKDSNFHQPIILNTLVDSISWLGSYDSLDINSWSCHISNKDSSSWFTNRKIANLWKKFSSRSPLFEYNPDLNEDCELDFNDVLLMRSILLKYIESDLLIDYNFDDTFNIYDFIHFIDAHNFGINN